MHDLKVVFQKAEDSFLIVDCELNEHHPLIFDNMFRDSHEVIIFNGYDELHNFRNGHHINRLFNNVNYELRFISATWQFEARVNGNTRTKWNGFVYSRHGGSRHKNWWYYGRHDKMAINWDSDFNFYSQEKLIVTYVRCNQLEVDKYRREFNTYIGGKNNIFCNKHICPLISSTARDITC